MSAFKKIERSLIETDLLRSFVVIAHCGNLTQAAQHLNRTQSAISVQLRRLESQLDAPLFERRARGMVLNDAGQQLLPKATMILTQLREVGSLFEDPLSGSIRVGFPDDFDDGFLEHVLTSFSATHPGVNVVASSGCTASYPEQIQRGEMDIAVFSAPGNEAGTYLCTERCVWAGKTGLKINPRATIPLAVLERHCWWRNMATNALNSVGMDYQVAFRSSSFASLQSAIRAGFAVGILPESSLAKAGGALSRLDDLPALPEATRSIIARPGAPKGLIAAMTGAIQNARLETGH